MKKLLIPTLALAFLLSACGGVKATVGSDPYSKQTQALVEKWIAAYRTRDTTAVLSLYSDDVTWSECSASPCDRYGLSDLKYYMLSDKGFGNPGFKIEPQSYFVTAFGYKAVVQVLYTDPNTGSVRAPSVVILEIKDGKIASETWYSAAMP